MEQPVHQEPGEPRHHYVQHQNNNAVAFLALAVAVAALVLAWVVYNNQPGREFRDTVRTETKNIEGKMEDTAEKTEATVREGVGTAAQKTGEVLEATGEVTQEAGTDIKNGNDSMRR